MKWWVSSKSFEITMSIILISCSWPLNDLPRKSKGQLRPNRSVDSFIVSFTDSLYIVWETMSIQTIWKTEKLLVRLRDCRRGCLKVLSESLLKSLSENIWKSIWISNKKDEKVKTKTPRNSTLSVDGSICRRLLQGRCQEKPLSFPVLSCHFKSHSEALDHEINQSRLKFESVFYQNIIIRPWIVLANHIYWSLKR